jgi:hypothetical protein
LSKSTIIPGYLADSLTRFSYRLLKETSVNIPALSEIAPATEKNFNDAVADAKVDPRSGPVAPNVNDMSRYFRPALLRSS